MGLGDFLHDALDGASNALNVVDRYVNPFHVEVHYEHGQKTHPGGHDNLLAPATAPIAKSSTATLETATAAWNWFYSKALSQPLSTSLLVAGNPGTPLSSVFSTDQWSKAWNAAAHISPGQAFMLTGPRGGSADLLHSLSGGHLGAQDVSVNKAISAPLRYAAPAPSDLPPEWKNLSDDQQQQILKDAGMPVTGNAYVHDLWQRHKELSWGSGTLDFAARWFADPAILGLKAASLGKAEMVTKSRPASGWSGSDIDKILAKSVMTKAQHYIFANRSNPQLLNNLDMAKKSAMGPRFGAVASTLQTPEEVSDFLRVGMGDMTAIERLRGQNALAAARLEADSSRLAALDLAHSRYMDLGTPHIAALVRGEMDTLQDTINADEALTSRYSQILDHSDELDEINLSRWGFKRAEQRTEAQNVYRAGAALHGGAARPRSIVASRPPVALASRPLSTPIESGFTKSRVYGLGDFFSTPVTMVRSLKEMHPNGFMRIDDIDKDSLAELRGHLSRIPGIKPETRQNIVNEYLKTSTEGERKALLDDVGRLGASRIAEKHGMKATDGLDIFKAHIEKQLGEIDNMKRYSAAMKPGEDGHMIHVDEFTTEGGKLALHPNTVTRLQNDYVFQDLDEMDRILARHSSALSAIRESRLGNPDWVKDAGDYLSYMWKFSTLFRLGYIPRVAGDDLAGQWARLGSAAMAARVGWGVKNGATNLAHWAAKPFYEAKEKTSLEGVKYADQEIGVLKPQMDALKAQVEGRRASNLHDLTRAQSRHEAAKTRLAALPPEATAVQRAATGKLVEKRAAEAEAAQRRYDIGIPSKSMRYHDMDLQMAHLAQFRDLSSRAAEDSRGAQKKVIQGNQPVQIGDQPFPAAFGGQRGDYYMKLISPDESIGNIFNTNKQLVHGNLQRSFSNGAKAISPAQDEALHLTAWGHALNAQLGQDGLGRLALGNASVDEMTHWLTRTPAGRAYRRRIGLKFTPAQELANSVWHDVAEYAPDDVLRQAALKGEVTDELLTTAVPNMAHRPDVHVGQVGLNPLAHKGALDRVVQHWFNWAATIPAKRLSRHPLFNQLYEGHLSKIVKQRAKQGAEVKTVAEVEQATEAARRLALRDTRKLVFDIAHKSDAAAALRFVSPFFSATAESFQRWGRIIADKPQVVGYASNLFNAPLAVGAMQDADGNHIDRNGYSYTIDPKTGRAVKRLVPKGERWLVARMPGWLAHSPVGLAFGVEPASGNLALSQNSMNMVTQGDPWFSPGVGPIVQIPVNEWVKDKPSQAEMARQLGILPFGPESGSSLPDRAMKLALPATVKNFMTAFDTSDERYQRIKLQIMQRAAFEHSELGKPMPSASKIASMTRDYWLFSAGSAFLQPMATQRRDKYQFFRDQYNNLRRGNPLTADQEFLDRFGESYFIFAQSESKNPSGIQATKKAVKLSEQYADLIAANPELGALIVGPEGNGPFSPEAYAYQLNHPLTPGGAEMQRGKMSAEEAMQENQRRLGWAKFTKKINGLTADLHKRGLSSFEDAGAEDLKNQKKAWTALYSEPLYPDGTPNPYYNQAWSEDWFTLDARKYDRMIPALTKVARSRLADEPNRSDLRVLQQYLGGRRQLLTELNRRGAAGEARTLAAQANADLAQAWSRFVDGLIESDTRFGDLHHRYLARDMGVDVTQTAQPQQEEVQV